MYHIDCVCRAERSLAVTILRYDFLTIIVLIMNIQWKFVVLKTNENASEITVIKKKGIESGKYKIREILCLTVILMLRLFYIFQIIKYCMVKQ